MILFGLLGFHSALISLILACRAALFAGGAHLAFVLKRPLPEMTFWLAPLWHRSNSVLKRPLPEMRFLRRPALWHRPNSVLK